MGKKFDIELELKAVDQGAGSTLDKMAKKLKLFKKESALSGERTLEQTLRSPEGLVGGFGELLGIGKLGVAGAILDKVGEGLSRAAEAMVKFKEGKATWADLADGFMRSVPVIGSLYGGLHDMKEALDGTTEAENRYMRSLERRTTMLQASTEAMAQTRNELRQMERDVAHQATTLGHVGESSLEKQLRENNQKQLDAQQAFEDERRKINASDMSAQQKSDARATIFGKLDKNGNLVEEGIAQKSYKNYLQSNADIMKQAGIDLTKFQRESNERLQEEQDQAKERKLRDRGDETGAAIQAIKNEQRMKAFALDEEQRQMEEKLGKQSVIQNEFAARRVQLEKDTAGRIRQVRSQAEEDQRQRDIERAELEDELSSLEKQKKGLGRGGSFQATLLSSRFHGLADADRERQLREKNNEQLATLNKRIEQLTAEIAKSGGTGMGYPLGYK